METLTELVEMLLVLLVIWMYRNILGHMNT